MGITSIEIDQRLVDKSVGINTQTVEFSDEGTMTPQDLFQTILRPESRTGVMENDRLETKKLMLAIVNGELPPSSMISLFERGVALGDSIEKIGFDSLDLQAIKNTSEEIYKGLLQDQEEITGDGKAVLPQDPIPGIQAKIGDAASLVPSIFLAGFSYGVLAREGTLDTNGRVPKSDLEVRIDGTGVLKARTFIKEQMKDTRLVDQLLGQDINSLKDLEQIEGQTKIVLPTYAKERVEPVKNGKKLSKTITQRADSENDNTKISCSVWDKEYIDPFATKARVVIATSQKAQDGIYVKDVATIALNIIQRSRALREKEYTEEEEYAQLDQENPKIQELTKIVDTAIASLSSTGSFKLDMNFASVCEELDRDEQQVVNLINSGINKYIFTTAERIGQAELTKQLLARDLNQGRIPNDIDERIDAFLLQQPLSKINPSEELYAVWEQYIRDQIRTDEKDAYQPKAIRRPAIVIERQDTTTQREIAIGPITMKTDIKSSEGPYPFAPEYVTTYPENVLRGFANVIDAYNAAFAPLVVANTEWNTDYQYTVGPNGLPLNRWVQVDMVSFFPDELETAANLSVEEATELVEGRVFEIENNLASYQECLRIFERNDQPSQFEREFRASLDEVRAMSGKKIALLAVTDQKYKAMKQSEFGKNEDDKVTDEEVLQLSGFDKFFGPEEFAEYVKNSNGDSEYLLYVRSSDPLAKLKDPSVIVDVPLLADDTTRRFIKANALTFNVDNPAWPNNDPKIITDTKMYLLPMGLAFPITTVADMESPEFAEFLALQGLDDYLVKAGRINLRGKPLLRSYGCYGQERGTIQSGKFKRNIRAGLTERGPYIIQPEMQMPVLRSEDGNEYGLMDRMYFYTDGKTTRFMGGCRYLMPQETEEFISGRIHGNKNSVLAEIKGNL